MEIKRPRYMGTSTDPGYQDHHAAMLRARGTFGCPIPPDHWQILTDREAHALFTHTRYLRARAELGYHSEGSEGMLFSVWEGCEPEDQETMARQMEEGAARKVAAEKAELKAQPQGWGDW